MHKALTVTAVVVLMGMGGEAASAADYYAPGYKDAAPVAYPNWTGYYLGGHIGGVWSTADFTDINVVPAVKFNNDTSGVFGGGQIGYAYQLGNIVIGPEADIGGMDLNASTGEAGGVGAVSAIRSGFYFDITGRLGYALGPALVYIKGGYAYYGGSLSVNDGVGSASHSDLGGWTGGGGIEYQITPVWSLKAEYQFFEFNTFQLIVSSDGNTFDDRFTTQTFKVGFNYHFSPLEEPLK